MPTSSKPTKPYLMDKQEGPSPYAETPAAAKKPKKKPVLSRFLLGDGLAGQAIDSLRKARQKAEPQTK